MRSPVIACAQRACVAVTAIAALGMPVQGRAQDGAAGADDVDAEALRCLALSMYWEARGEGDEGMLAVGSVVLNRVRSDDFPDSVCRVVYDGGETPPCQFSWWCDGKSDRPQEEDLWEVAMKLAAEMLRSPPPDPTGGALFFHSAAIDMPWRVPRTRTAEIANHVYYR